MDYTEFKVSIQNKPRSFRVTGSWGVYDAYKAIRRQKWFNIGGPVSEKNFYAIIRGINRILAEGLVNGTSIVFPQMMGRLELRKYEVGVKLDGDKLKNTYPIDWGNTYKLWYSDPEAYKNKILLRIENPQLYRIKYCTSDAKFPNKMFYKFTLCNKIKKDLSNNLKQKKVDTLW